MISHRIDVIGDVHGHLDALVQLGRQLGYDVDGDWDHPDGRVLLFVGDLVDRGPKSLEVAELVQDLVRRDRAVCLMGNHEYNLVAWRRGIDEAKASNRSTIADVERRADRWSVVFDFLGELPVAIELPELRVVHAVWHSGCIARVTSALAPRRVASNATSTGWLRAHAVVGSPFGPSGLVEGLPLEPVGVGGDSAHAVLLKGYEEPAPAPFVDSDGARRENTRVAWWLGARAEIPTDRRVVFGHYWSVPPTSDEPVFAPPHPSGHRELREWQHDRSRLVAPSGEVAVPPEQRLICIDFNGVTVGSAARCVGAFRWPEGKVAWAMVRG